MQSFMILQNQHSTKTDVDRKITTLVNAIGKLAEFDGSVDGSAFSKLAKSLDEVAAKAIAARDAASGVDIRKAFDETFEIVAK